MIMGNHGLIRTVIGNFFEDATAQHVNGARHRTDSRCDYCPDVSNSDSFYEVKAVGRSKQVLIYRGRLQKDLIFASTHKLFYCIWHHSVLTTELETVLELKRSLLNSNPIAYVVPFSEVYRVCKSIEVTPLNSKYGGSNSRAQYGSGYRVPISKFKDFRSA